MARQKAGPAATVSEGKTVGALQKINREGGARRGEGGGATE